ncbi:acyltransferase [Bacillus sp. MUM 116]|uniref:Acyltransferase n=1 Tax=Bacillus xiapuensis TaxID=2014075 RepID=A0ABU6NA59_9BACI|nr:MULTISPECIES: acyltransferase [Bacillus]MED3563098.1 acyltransferase [Bacillus xiapuensis]OIK16317.1 acyltransferase [Bacillus sp. MUM 116]
MYFEHLLDAILGERQIFHIIECPVCGLEEIYYENSKTRRLIGRACCNCNFVQKFDF